VNVAFPYSLDEQGRTSSADWDDHLRQMLEQLLFTRPGERVNRPDFGCGLLDLVFGPNSPEVAAALTLTVSAAVQQWLGDVIALSEVHVTSIDSELTVNLGYRVLATGVTTAATLVLPSVT
jgi:phage baseplate assembly protein W